MRFKDKTGMRFGKLTVLEFIGMRKTGSLWKCRCDCGRIVNVSGQWLTPTRVACGCTRGLHGITHGETRHEKLTPEYSSFTAMLSRCQNPKHSAYHNYGGRGIRVCEEWNCAAKYSAFLAHVGRRPTIKHTLDRIDTNGHYEPGNVRWSTRLEQNRHTRKSKMLCVNGERLCLSELTAKYGVDYHWAWRRLRRGMSPHQALGLQESL